MRAWVEKVTGLSGGRHYGLTFLAGLLSVLALPPFSLWPILFLTLSILVWQLDGIYLRPPLEKAAQNQPARRLKWTPLMRAALTGWVFGFGYFLAGFYWVGMAFLVEAEKFAWLMPFAVSLLPAGLALFYGSATALAFLLWRPGVARLLALSFSFALFEWLRGHIFTGFPWNLLGYGLTTLESLLQWASVFGVYGLTLFCVLFFPLPALLIEPSKSQSAAMTRPTKIFLLSLCGLFLVALIGGQWRLSQATYNGVEGVRLRIVQPAIPQTEKWKPGNQAWIFRRYLDLSERNPELEKEDLANITYLIWPEVALPFLLAREKGALQALQNILPEGSLLLTGALRVEPFKPSAGRDVEGPVPDEEQTNRPPQRRVYNSLFAINHEGRIISTYDKTRLVPFGEYLPFQNLLEAVGLRQLTSVIGGFTAGSGPRLLDLPALPGLSPSICYEIIFSGAVRKHDTKTSWILNITNDAWFGRTSGPYQHFHQARVRAVEEGVPVIRVANTGISAVIDPYGRIRDQLALNHSGVIESLLPIPIESTVFVTYGRVIFAFLLILNGGIYFFYRSTVC